MPFYNNAKPDSCCRKWKHVFIINAFKVDAARQMCFWRLDTGVKLLLYFSIERSKDCQMLQMVKTNASRPFTHSTTKGNADSYGASRAAQSEVLQLLIHTEPP